MLAALSEAIEARDPYTRGHSVRVTALAYAVADRLGWSAERLATLRLGGALHDVGKLSVSPRILRKRGPLSTAERAEIELHPVAGVRLIGDYVEARPAVPYVLHHHERWDGTGYPGRLGEAEIPVEARLLAIADAFDAMTSERPYRAAISTARALDELARCAGAQFDPAFTAAFLDVWGRAARAAS
jgi:HD-GYP domain-containing protein (c-di-GMP phosphodiesterase class II)